MKNGLISVMVALLPLISAGQGLQRSGMDNPDLGLHGKVSWSSATKISVEYDWSNDNQLLDWIPTHGSTLVRENGSLTIKDGIASVRSMVWKQLIKCRRIYVQDAIAVNSPKPHLNFITNVLGWTGYNFCPDNIIGAICNTDANYWLERGVPTAFSQTAIQLGHKYNVEIIISDNDITLTSSVDGVTKTHGLASPPDDNRQVALGGWEGDTKWGKVVIEGEVDTSFAEPLDMIDIQTYGSNFSPVIEVKDASAVEWRFDDGSTSASFTPSVNYGSDGFRHNLLKVTPWSALKTLNLGYDAADEGYGNFALVPDQKVLGIRNLSLAKEGLQAICLEFSEVTDLDLSAFSSLQFIELPFNRNLGSVKLGSHPVLERITVEECNLPGIDISGCPALKDMRGAVNKFTSINWGTIGSSLLHICVRTNPDFTVNVPDLSQFPSLTELLTWDANQTGPLTCHSGIINRIDAYDNHYSSADLSGSTLLTQLSLSGSKLSSLDLTQVNNLLDVKLSNCWLSASLTDYVLTHLDEAGLPDGNLELDGNAPPSSAGLAHMNNLVSKGWTVTITDPSQEVLVGEIEVVSNNGQNVITAAKGTLDLSAISLPDYATDKSVQWSIINGTGVATIDSEGTVTAVYDGTVTARATASDGSGTYGEFAITISGQASSENEQIIPVVTGNELKVLLNSNYINWKARLINIRGDLISSKYIDSDIVTFDISSVPPGIVIVVLEKGNNLRVTKAFIP